MSLTKKLIELGKKVATTEVELASVGKVQLKALEITQRLELYNPNSLLKDCSFAQAVVALSVCENNQRMVKSMDVQEVVSFFDALPMEEFTQLYAAASELSGLSKADQEQAEKN